MMNAAVAINEVTTLGRDGHVAVLTLDSPPVNALTAAVRDGLAFGVRLALQDPATRAIVILCAGRTFIAGADMASLDKPPEGTDILEVLATIEEAPVPVIAAIHGTALGGGLEVALACHHRVAVPSARCGLPEVKLGLVPGAGGTQRLPRLVGARRALEMITSGEHVGAADCAEMGLVDAIVSADDLRSNAIAFARRVAAEDRPLRRVRDLDDKVGRDRADAALFADFRRAHAKRFRGFDAPEAAIRCVEAAVTLPFDEGMKLEGTLSAGLIAGPQFAAQRHVFFAERAVWKVPGLPAGTPTLPITRVGIVGSGTMGGGIAMNFANIGLPITMVETSTMALERGLATVRRNYEAAARRGRITQEAVEERMALLAGTLDLGALSDCDLIIEAVFEDMSLKKSLFARLDALAKPDTILASNTSRLDLDEIAAATRRPESVIGLHFFSPANVMRLLEVVRGARTAAAVVATSMQLARRIGKVGVLVGVCHGFLCNRMLATRQRQAQALVLEGSLPWEVDRTLVDFGFPMGPFAMSDLAGLDLGWTREQSSGQTLAELLCERDRRGQKTSAGYYDYDAQRRPTPSPAVEQLVLELASRKGIRRRPIGEDEILQRCLYPVVNEGARVLEEGIASRASDIDVAWIHGYGWPLYRGGPMFHADSIGLHNVLAGLRRWEQALGPDFTPADLLVRLAAQGKRFQDLAA